MSRRARGHPATPAAAVTAEDKAAGTVTWAVTLSGGDRAELVTGRDYVIVYRLHGQQYDRQARVGFLTADPAGNLEWNGRPACGTTLIPASVISTVTDAGRSLREDPARYAGKRAGHPAARRWRASAPVPRTSTHHRGGQA